MEKHERVIERFLEYVKIDSPTLEEMDFKNRLKKDLDEIGIKYVEDDAGKKIGSNTGNLIAYLEGQGDRTILFSAHMDTVSPGKGIKPVIKDGTIYSDGTTVLGSDDKVGVSIIMEMLKVLKENKIPHHNIEVVFTVSEEVGIRGSKYLDYSKLHSDFGIVLDSGGPAGHTVVQGPAQTKIDVVFKGKSAHAGVAPEEGISAIQIAAEAISKMKLLRIDEETTANIGSIQGGGPTNIVPDKVSIKAEARSLNDDKLSRQVQHMVQCVKETQKKYGIEAEITLTEAYKAFKVELDSLPAKFIKDACRKIGVDFVPKKTGGGSDTNNYNLNGIPSLNLGVGMSKVHSTEEYVQIKDILDATKLVIEIAKI